MNKGKESDALKVDYAFARNIGDTSADIIWSCSSSSQGIITFGDTGFENPQFIFYKQKIHFYKLSSLSSGKIHSYQVGCVNERKVLYIIQKFQTTTPPPPPVPEIAMTRGLWIIGGIGNFNLPIAPIDLYDPVTDIWYPTVTNIPNPRSYASIVSLNNKIYIIGGMKTDSAGMSTVSNLVEEYTPSTNVWKILSSAPVSIQGALGSVSGNSIYLLGGSVTTSAAAAIPNVVYKFTPNSGIGLWTTLTSASAIPARMDLSGCSTDGTIFFSMGRDSTGTSQFASDAYISSANTTTSITEGNFSLSRYGTSSSCYRPKSTDLFPLDPSGIFLAGGSTLGNSTQPPTAILASNRFDFYLTPSNTNTVLTGPSLPANLYAPASEISYETRRLYVFGGATIINVPTNVVYSLDLKDPSTGPWTTLVRTMPNPRYAHSAIILNR